MRTTEAVIRCPARFALSGFSAGVIITLIFLFFYGPEERAKNFQK
jgi:hypothetical protein